MTNIYQFKKLRTEQPDWKQIILEEQLEEFSIEFDLPEEDVERLRSLLKKIWAKH